MNKRIDDLIAQATYVSESDDPDYRYESFDKKKFAESLVRECIWAAQNKDDTCMDLRYCRAVAAGKIREHFGVEK
jgi:hypothetical protein